MVAIKVLAKVEGRVRLHIDHVDNAGGQVWAVRVGGWQRGRAWICHWVYVTVPMATRVDQKAPAGQARAWLEVRFATLTVKERTGTGPARTWAIIEDIDYKKGS